MLRFRIISGVVLGGALFAAALRLPLSGLSVAFAVVAALGAAETARLFKSAGIKHEPGIALIAAVLLIFSSWAEQWWGAGLIVGQAESLVLVGFVILLVLVVLFRRDSKPLESVPATLCIVLYVPFLLNFLAKVVTDWPEGDGRYLALYMIFIVKMMDIGAYFTGRAIGRHKVFPRISPGKTWEGCIGGVVFATTLGAAVWWVFHGDFGVLKLRFVDALALGVLLSIAGILGDLVESMLKRAAGVKDSGEWIRGMGGVLDVIDSLLLASPVLYVYVHLLRI